jgi:curli biogenesis system outer membrane secretion channel CsgG
MTPKKTFLLLCILTIAVLFSMPTYLHSQDNPDVALNALTEQISRFMGEQKKTRIAIIPFTDIQKQTITVLGSYLSEELTTNLFMTGRFKIVERSLLKQILDELKLSQTGIVDTNSAKQLGKMAGVDALVAGTIADIGSYIAINCRLIETESGEIFAAAKAKITKDENIRLLMDEVVDKGEYKDRNQRGSQKIKDGIYDVQAGLIKIDRWLEFIIAKVEIQRDNIIIQYCVRTTYPNLGTSARTFKIKEAFILNTDNKIEKFDLKQIEGLELEVDEESKYYYKILPNDSKIWGSFYFPRFDLSSPKFLLYINGIEREVKLVPSNK